MKLSIFICLLLITLVFGSSRFQIKNLPGLTFTPNFFATKKCPASCTRTRTERTSKKTRIVIIIEAYVSYKNSLSIAQAAYLRRFS